MSRRNMQFAHAIQPDQPAAAAAVDYSQVSWPDLQKEASKRGLYNHGMTREDIITALQVSDAK